MKNAIAVVGVAILALVVSSSAFAGTVALWDYNTGTFAPSMGSGSMVTGGHVAFDKWDTDLGDFGGLYPDGSTAGKVVNGMAENNSTDPMPITNPGTAIASRGLRDTYKNWLTTDAPGYNYVGWKVSTEGIATDDIKIALDVRLKAYDARYYQLMYTTDGITWNYSPVWQGIDAGGDLTLWNNVSWDLTGLGVAGKKDFAFRFIEAYGPGQSSYEPAWSGIAMKSGVYAFDMVEVYSGTSDVTRVASPFGPAPGVPEPGSILALCSGLVGLLGFARKRTR